MQAGRSYGGYGPIGLDRQDLGGRARPLAGRKSGDFRGNLGNGGVLREWRNSKGDRSTELRKQRGPGGIPPGAMKVETLHTRRPAGND